MTPQPLSKGFFCCFCHIKHHAHLSACQLAHIYDFAIVTCVTINTPADAVMQVVLTLTTVCIPGCYHATDTVTVFHLENRGGKSLTKFSNSSFVLHRLQNSLSEGYCGKDCEDSLQHMLTTHIRARYLAGQVSPNSVQSGAGAFVEEQQATVRLQHKLASLFQRYIEQKGLQRG